MYRTLMAAALCLTAWPALAQPGAADADAPVPATRYASPLEGYRPAHAPAQPPAATWRTANETVAAQGGMHAHAMPKKHVMPPEKDKHQDHMAAPHAGEHQP